MPSRSRGLATDSFGAGGVGDVDMDGADDFIVGAGGVVRLMSGMTGLELGRTCVFGPSSCGGNYGLQPVGLGDINGDQVPDFAVSAYNVSLPHSDGDGLDDWAVSNFGYGPTTLSGRVIVLAGTEGDIEHVCSALPHSLGRPAEISFYDAISVGSRGLEVHIRRAIPDSVALILYGPRAAPTPFGDGQLCVDPGATVRYSGALRLDADGDLNHNVDWGDPTIRLGATAWTVGSSWTIQAVFRDPGVTSGLHTTSVVEATFN